MENEEFFNFNQLLTNLLTIIKAHKDPNSIRNDKGQTILSAAALSLKKDTVLFIAKYVDPNLQPDAPDFSGNTTLHTLISNEHDEIALEFIRLWHKKIDFSIYDCQLKTALILAVKMNKTQIASEIINHMTADQINQQDEDGNTALHYAIFLGNPILVIALRTAGARNDIKNDLEKTPADYKKDDIVTDQLAEKTLKSVAVDPERARNANSDTLRCPNSGQLLCRKNPSGWEYAKLPAKRHNTNQQDQTVHDIKSLDLFDPTTLKEKGFFTPQDKEQLINMYLALDSVSLLANCQLNLEIAKNCLSNGYTPEVLLRLFAKRGDFFNLQKLFCVWPKLNVNAFGGTTQKTALHFLCENTTLNHSTQQLIYNFLVEHEANPNQKDLQGNIAKLPSHDLEESLDHTMTAFKI